MRKDKIEYQIYNPQEDNHEQICFYNDPPEIDGFKALACPSIDELEAIEDARARHELLNSVYKLLNDLSGRFITEKFGLEDPRGNLPSDHVIELLKDSLIEFNEKMKIQKKVSSPTMEQCLKDIKNISKKEYKSP